GSRSSRHSLGDRFVAWALQEAGLGTLLLDLLTREEEAVDVRTSKLRFDIELLAGRLVGATRWLVQQRETADLRIGCFGASTGAAAALVAAAQLPDAVGAGGSRGGRADLAGSALPVGRCPTWLIVGGEGTRVIGLNHQAFSQLGGIDKQLVIVPGASHLFEEPGTLEEVARLAADWFGRQLLGPPAVRIV